MLTPFPSALRAYRQQHKLQLQVPRSDPAADTVLVQSDAQQAGDSGAPAAADEQPDGPVKTSLLAATAKARKGAPKETEDQKRLKEEQEMLHNITNRTALKTFAELAAVGLHDITEYDYAVWSDQFL